jgi:hypothetical protein
MAFFFFLESEQRYAVVYTQYILYLGWLFV